VTTATRDARELHLVRIFATRCGRDEARNRCDVSKNCGQRCENSVGEMAFLAATLSLSLSPSLFTRERNQNERSAFAAAAAAATATAAAVVWH